jgi:stage II sporulation protein D
LKSNPLKNPAFLNNLVAAVAGLLFFAAASCAAAAEPKTPIRVLIADNQKSVKITIEGAYRLILLPSMQVIKKGQKLNVVLSPTPRGLRVGTQEWPAEGVRIDAAVARDIYVNKSRFRGSVQFKKASSGLLYGVNRLDIEDYLYGVLHYEVSSWWPMEALKAQAIAARSYATYQASVSQRNEYDLKSGTSSQVYGGSANERYRTNKAVDATRGEVLTHKGKIFPAYFHATCGGLTAGAKELWKIDVPPLVGRKYCGFCRLSPHFNWTAKVPLSLIEEKMNKNGRPLGQILSIELVTRTPSNRVGSLRVTGTLQETVVAAKDFRVWIGGDKMRSTSYSVEIDEDTAVFRGKGWGHGVGLCQWGALGQALLGRHHEEILRFYYPASDITELIPGGASRAS